MKQPLFFFALIMLGYGVYAQTNHEKKHYTDENGRLFWNKALPVYLRVASTPDDKGLLLKSETMPEYASPFYLDTEGKNLVRTRYAVDTATGKTITPQREILWEIYADGQPPRTRTSFFNAPSFRNAQTIFYGHGLEIELTATDAQAGVENIYYANNGNAYSHFSQNLKYQTEGKQSLNVYATDKVGNAETPEKFDFVIDLSPPETNLHITGIELKNNIISTATKLFLTAKDNLSGVAKTYYQIDDYDKTIYTGKNIPIAHLSDGMHKLKYYSTDQVNNQENELIYDFYLDKTAPILASDILGDRFIVNEQIYFSGRTKLKLTAVDNKAGVKDILFSIDGEEFKSYNEPFYLPSKPGIHVVRYFALDKLQNETEGSRSTRYQEFKHNVSKIYVDLTGPNVSHAFVGNQFNTRDTLFISPKTKIKLSASDSESGLQYISYSVDGELTENKYTQPFSIEKHGRHSIEVFGYDNVNNRNIRQFNFVVDSEAPEIGHTFSIRPLTSKDGKNVYPKYVKIYLSAQDAMIGTQEIYYSVNGGTMVPYRGHISGFVPDGINKLMIKAVDELQNESEKTLEFYLE